MGLSLASAASWGAGDFTGGIAAKRTSVFGLVVAAHTTGFLLVLALILLTRESMPSRLSLLWAMTGGLLGSIGLAAFYRALAIGKMGINAPVAAVITAALPVAVGILLQGRPGKLQLIGFVIAIIGIVLVSKPELVHERPAGMGLAVLAGVGFGGFLTCMKLASATAVLWPLCVSRLASALLMLGFCLFTRQSSFPSPKLLPLAVLTGTLDTAGNGLYMLATQLGRLDVAVVLSSLYPVTTVILASSILKERMNRIQTAGMVAVLVAIPLIAA
ncbi:MAG TPA: DMT family transporter [Terriglobales bacterium]|nr:DMT family transporter [Terriglobales bacterium]